MYDIMKWSKRRNHLNNRVFDQKKLQGKFIG